ncbi:MAG: hypothetical protein ACPL3E_02750 [Minisyncoccia bacterium]
MNDQNQFYYIKKIANDWVEREELLTISNSWSDSGVERSQLRKCIDLFKKNLVELPSIYQISFIENLIYKIKLALIKLEYQNKRNKIRKIADELKEKANGFLEDLKRLKLINYTDQEKTILLKKIMIAFKNVINQIYVKNY